MVAQIVLRSERVQNWRLRPSTTHQTRRSPTGRGFKKKKSLPKVFDLVDPAWQGSAAQLEPTLTEAGICQRSWQQPMGVRLEGEETESDVEEKCIRHYKVKEKS